MFLVGCTTFRLHPNRNVVLWEEAAIVNKSETSYIRNLEVTRGSNYVLEVTDAGFETLYLVLHKIPECSKELYVSFQDGSFQDGKLDFYAWNGIRYGVIDATRPAVASVYLFNDSKARLVVTVKAALWERWPIMGDYKQLTPPRLVVFKTDLMELERKKPQLP